MQKAAALVLSPLPPALQLLIREGKSLQSAFSLLMLLFYLFVYLFACLSVFIWWSVYPLWCLLAGLLNSGLVELVVLIWNLNLFIKSPLTAFFLMFCKNELFFLFGSWCCWCSCQQAAFMWRAKVLCVKTSLFFKPPVGFVYSQKFAPFLNPSSVFFTETKQKQKSISLLHHVCIS